MAYPAFIDAEVVETESDNLIQFPDNPVNLSREPDNVPRQPSGQPDYSSADLSEVVGVSRQAWIKDWLPHLAKVVPLDALKSGRRYTILCSELNLSLLAARRSGQSSSAWVAAASARRPQQGIEERAEIVAMAAEVSIVPIAVEQVTNGQALALVQATQLQDFTQILLARASQTLDLNTQQVASTNQSISDATIIAQETARILHEEQLKVGVRARFEAQKQAAIAQKLQADLAQLQGGQHA
jgi:hypothetical protein